MPPEYEYKAPSGRTYDRYHVAGHAPATAWINGEKCERVFSVPQVVTKETIASVTSSSLPKGWKYAPDHDAEGRPRFKGRREIREAVAKANDEGEGVHYDY